MARSPTLTPEARKAALVAAARRIFSRDGFHRAGVAQICDEAGVARGTFYNYFESKRTIFGAVVESMMAEVLSVVVPIDVGRPIPGQVVANVERLVRAVAVDDVAKVLFGEAVGIDAEGDAALREFYGFALGRIEAALLTGQALGVVRAGETGLTARCLLGLLKEPVVQAALAGEALDVEGLVAAVGRVLRGGILVG
ncbi:MAG: TetR/AcrR family transcriptional regulator [Deltaproteobacteria bacterium]|nr:TetR/AcrR family transcriptional regulator [Deltaproteobacteria bacterium]